METWKLIEMAPDYEVSTLGRVRGWRKGCRKGMIRRVLPRIIKPLPDKDGYLRVKLALQANKTKRFMVHRLVLLAYKGRPGLYETASHLNGIRTDNRLDNLTWESQRTNIARKREHGTWQEGEKGSRVKLSWDKVIEIRQSFLEGLTLTEIARKYDVTRTNIGYIVRGITWKSTLL